MCVCFGVYVSPAAVLVLVDHHFIASCSIIISFVRQSVHPSPAVTLFHPSDSAPCWLITHLPPCPTFKFVLLSSPTSLNPSNGPGGVYCEV